MCMDALATAKLFTTIDLQSGYWNFELDEEDAEKTAIITKQGLYQCTRLSFGLRNSGDCFQRTVELVFRSMQWQSVVIYLHDFIIYSGDDYVENIQKVDEVLERIEKAGLKLKPPSVSFYKVKYYFWDT